MSSHTKKLEVSKLKVGMKFRIPAQEITVKLVDSLEVPTLEENLFVIHCVGSRGPFKGKTTEITAWAGDKVELVLRSPPLRRLWSWAVKVLWGSKP